MIRKTTDLGNINLSLDVVANITGNAATECYGVVGMASQKIMKDGFYALLGRDNYSKGVVYVYDKLKNSNHNEIDLKLWPGLRHEILNEKSNKEVYEYISSWTDGKI